jgi:peptidoglycan hydrolase FlgJ
MTSVHADTAARAPALDGASAAAREAGLVRVATEFESVFLSQMLREMTAGLTGPGPLAGAADDPFAAMLQDEYARLIAGRGGIGIADAVLAQLLENGGSGR